MNRREWIVTLIGSREHYAIPRAFNNRGLLQRFYTDLWIGRGRGIVGKLPGGFSTLAGRFHPGLPASKVMAFNLWSARCAMRDILARGRRSMDERFSNYDRVGREFAEQVNRHLQRVGFDPERSAAFLFSTGALETARFLRGSGVPVIVDQLDPGRLDETMIRAEMGKFPGWEEAPGRIPESYFQRLAEEWKLADLVLVNSRWSRQNLLQEGIEAGKIIVVPLCYEREVAEEFKRSPKPAGTPLTVLWLGQIVLRKGIPYLFDAARALAGTKIRFLVAGRIGISPKGLEAAPPNVSILGKVSREKSLELFREADVFVLPTVSDGFALTQLEAMSFGLPVITTPNCGDVVSDGVDGFIIPPCQSEPLAEAILRLDRDRELLRQMSLQATEKVKQRRFSLDGYVDAVESGLASVMEPVAP